jgi:hypothetical protein
MLNSETAFDPIWWDEERQVGQHPVTARHSQFDRKRALLTFCLAHSGIQRDKSSLTP